MARTDGIKKKPLWASLVRCELSQLLEWIDGRLFVNLALDGAFRVQDAHSLFAVERIYRAFDFARECSLSARADCLFE